MSTVLTFYAGLFVGLGLAVCTRALAERGEEVDRAARIHAACARINAALSRENEALDDMRHEHGSVTRVPASYFASCDTWGRS